MTFSYRSGSIAIGAFELKKTYQRNLILGLSIAAMLHFMIIGSMLLYNFLRPVEIVVEKPKLPWDIKLYPPPSLTQERPPQIEIALPEIVPPALGIPTPVPDALNTREVSFPTQEQLEALTPPAETEGYGEGAFKVPEGQLPGPEDFVATEILPKPITKIAAIYPELARRAGITGTVLLRVLVDKFGKVRDVLIFRPSGTNVGFEEAAREAVRQWTFSPAIQNGQPVAVWVDIPIRFEVK